MPSHQSCSFTFKFNAPVTLGNLDWTPHEVETSFASTKLRRVRNELGLKLLIRDKKEPLLLLRKKWHILREACEPSLWPWASYQKFVNAKLDTGQPSLRHPYHSDHLPPVILLPETSVHLASLPPPPPTLPVLLSFILFFGPFSSLSARLLPPVLCEPGEIRCVREIPELLPHTILNGICQQLDGSTQETDLPARRSHGLGGKTIPTNWNIV